VSSFAAYLATYRSHHVRRRPERLNCLRPSPFSARLQFVQKVNRLHFLRRLHFLITSDLKIHAIICHTRDYLIIKSINQVRACRNIKVAPGPRPVAFVSLNFTDYVSMALCMGDNRVGDTSGQLAMPQGMGLARRPRFAKMVTSFLHPPLSRT